MEAQASIGEMIRFSWAKSREILFPFQFKRWIKILVIVWLAGTGIQTVSTNFKAPAKPGPSSLGVQKITAPQLPPGAPLSVMRKMPQAPQSAGAPGPSLGQVQGPSQKGVKFLAPGQDSDRMAALRAKMGRAKRKASPAIVALLVAGMVILVAGFAVFFLWLSSRFNFVLLDAIVTREPEIKEPFRRHREAGNSYFVWSLAFVGISFGALLLAVLVIVLSVGIAKWKLVIGAPLVILGGILFLAVSLAMIFFGTVMRDFAVPVMYREKISALSAMNRFLEADTFAFGKVFQYLLVVFGLWILAVIVQGIAGVLAAVGGLIAGAMVAIPGVLLIKALPLLKFPLLLLGGLFAVALVLAVIVVTGMVMLPAVIFFRVFALTYLTRLYPECDLIGFAGGKE